MALNGTEADRQTSPIHPPPSSVTPNYCLSKNKTSGIIRIVLGVCRPNARGVIDHYFMCGAVAALCHVTWTGQSRCSIQTPRVWNMLILFFLPDDWLIPSLLICTVVHPGMSSSQLSQLSSHSYFWRQHDPPPCWHADISASQKKVKLFPLKSHRRSGGSGFTNSNGRAAKRCSNVILWNCQTSQKYEKGHPVFEYFTNTDCTWHYTCGVPPTSKLLKSENCIWIIKQQQQKNRLFGFPVWSRLQPWRYWYSITTPSCQEICFVLLLNKRNIFWSFLSLPLLDGWNAYGSTDWI